YQAIRNGDSEIVVAGGQESMSQAPHCIHLRNGTKMGDAQMVDTMIKDGLWDAFNGYHMGNTAENVAQRWQITREQQDEFAARSQERTEAAQKAGRFKDEIVPAIVSSRRRPVRSARNSASTPRSSTSMAARSRSATRSAPRAPGSSSRCCTRCGGATRKRAWRHCASAAVWELRCALPAIRALAVGEAS